MKKRVFVLTALALLVGCGVNPSTSEDTSTKPSNVSESSKDSLPTTTDSTPVSSDTESTEESSASTEDTSSDSEQHTHSFGDWVSVDDKTHQRECACGEKETADHEWSEEVVIEPSTITSKGQSKYTCLDCGYVKTVETDKKIDANLIYSLDFENADDRAASAVDTTCSKATIVNNGGLTYETNGFNGKTAAKFTSSGAHQNYIRLPKEIMNNDEITVTGWFNLSSAQKVSWARLFYMASDVENVVDVPRLEMMPFQGNYYGVKWDLLDAVDNSWNDGWLNQGRAYEGDPNTPAARGAVQSTDVWVHYSWVLKDQGFKFYANGLCIFEDSTKNLSPKHYAGDNAGITLFATFRDNSDDFSGSVADVRVYNKELTEGEILDVADVDFESTKTFDVDFENGIDSSVRGFTGTKRGDTSIVEENGSKVAKFVGGTKDTQGIKYYGKQILAGSHQLTIDTDVYVDPSSPSYGRIFQGQINSTYGGCILALWTDPSGKLCLKWSQNFDIDASYMDFPCTFGVWHHITISLDSKSVIVMVDGSIVSSTSFVYYDSVFYDTTTCFFFGDQDVWDDGAFVGKIDNFTLYSYSLQKALSAFTSKIDGLSIYRDDKVNFAGFENFRYRYDELDDMTKAIVKATEGKEDGTALEKLIYQYDVAIFELGDEYDFLGRFAD